MAGIRAVQHTAEGTGAIGATFAAFVRAGACDTYSCFDVITAQQACLQQQLTRIIAAIRSSGSRRAVVVDSYDNC